MISTDSTVNIQTEICTILGAATSRVQNPDFEEDLSEQSDNKKHPKDSC